VREVVIRTGVILAYQGKGNLSSKIISYWNCI